MDFTHIDGGRVKMEITKDWQLWQQQHNHPIALTTEPMFYQKMEYIHRNPVEAGLKIWRIIYIAAQRDFYD